MHRSVDDSPVDAVAHFHRPCGALHSREARVGCHEVSRMESAEEDVPDQSAPLAVAEAHHS